MLLIEPSGIRDAEDAAVWYEDQQPGLGIQFLLEVIAAIDKAAETPEAYAKLYRDVRRVLARRFPYAVYFKYTDGNVKVFAVLHQHQNWLESE